MRKYSISKTSRFLGISNELLRHYERLSLIEPERSENGYRFFGSRDIDKLQGIRRYRNMGFSLSEMDKLIYTGDFDEVRALYETCRARTRRELLWQEELLACSERILAEWDAIGRGDFACRRVVSPAILRVNIRVNDEIHESDFPEQVESWMERMPVVFISPRFPQEGILSSSEDIQFGYGVRTENFERLALPHLAEETEIPAQDCVTLIIHSSGDGRITCRALAPAVDYCAQQRLSICGDAWGITIGNCVVDGVVHRYHRVYVPVAEKRKSL